MVSLWQQVEKNKNHGQSDFLWQKLQPLGKQFRGRWTALTIKKIVSSLKFIQAVHMVKQTWQFWQNSQNSKCGVGDLGMRRWQCGGLGILAKWSWQTLKVNNVAKQPNGNLDFETWQSGLKNRTSELGKIVEQTNGTTY